MAPPRKETKKSEGIFGGLFKSSKAAPAPEPVKGKSAVSGSSSSSSKSRSSSSSKSSSSSSGKAAPAVSVKATVGPAAPAAAPKQPASMRADDAKAAWQRRPRMPSRLLDTYVNFMVLGESGLGKTTFIQNLTSNYRKTSDRVHDGSSTALAQFQADPDSLKTVLEPMEIPESSRRLRVTIQDMPGWGDDINLARYLRVVTAFLLEQRAKDYEKLNGARGMDEASMCGQLQHGVTACLYFLPPHRVKKIDLIMMAAVSQLVTVIPVIAKSDAMTDGELKAYRAELLDMIGAPSKYAAGRNLPTLEVEAFQFADEILADLGMDKAQLPVAIVSSRDEVAVEDPSFLASLGLEGVDKPTQPVRKYKWGACYPLNRGHSNLILLKRLLLGDRVDSLYALLDDSYGRYVSFCDMYEDNDRVLQMVVQDACAVGGPHLEYDDYAKAKVALDSAKAAMSTLSEENRVLSERLVAAERERKALTERVRAAEAAASKAAQAAPAPAAPQAQVA